MYTNVYRKPSGTVKSGSIEINYDSDEIEIDGNVYDLFTMEHKYNLLRFNNEVYRLPTFNFKVAYVDDYSVIDVTFRPEVDIKCINLVIDITKSLED